MRIFMLFREKNLVTNAVLGSFTSFIQTYLRPPFFTVLKCKACLPVKAAELASSFTNHLESDAPN